MRLGQQGIAAWMGIAAFALAGCAGIPGAPARQAHWVASWGTANMVPDDGNLLPAESYRDASLRELVHVSLGGDRIRVRLSNVWGTQPLTIEAATVALSTGTGQAGIVASTLRKLTFSGRESIMIPARAEYYSDPVELTHSPGADLALSIHYGEPPATQTGHPGSRTTSFLVKGNRVAETAWPDAQKIVRWYQIADVEVQAPSSVHAVSAIGDSITDGHGATTDGNDRWSDALARRLQREGLAMGVVNTGIGGNRLLRDGLGPNVASRFDRDVVARAGVTHAIVLISVNDMGILHRNQMDTPQARAQLVADLESGFRQIVERAHAHGICMIGGTVVPYSNSNYYHPGPENENDRLALNEWIRTSGVFDAIADFDAALRDPQHPERMLAGDDMGDGLHPSPAGFRAMAEAVPLEALRRCPRAVGAGVP